MSSTIRKLIPFAIAALAAQALGAQSVFDSELRLAPQFLQYRIGTPSNETIRELAIPVFVSIPFGPNFTFDVGTAYANARVTNGTTVSEISGLTDTQLRGNLTLGSDFVVLTGGVNLPTGKSTVTEDQFSAAGRIGSDFLAFPISNMGTGFAYTGGIAVARPLGEWNLGFGGSMRKSASYDPYNIGGTKLHFQPGNEYRGRVGLDHPFGSGRISLGVTYSAFGDDAAGPSVYNTGNRIIAQTVISNTYAGTDVTLAGYDVYRASGTLSGGEASGKENIINGYLGIGLHMLGTVIEPSFEARNWYQIVPAGSFTNPGTTERNQASYLGTVGVRTKIDLGNIALFPSGGYTFGALATVTSANALVHSDLTGFKLQLAARISP
jgi:hypothetical protein